MPAILSPEDQQAWIDSRTNRTDLLAMLNPFPESKTKLHPVSRAVNQPENDNPDLISRIDGEVGTTMSLSKHFNRKCCDLD